MWTPVYMKKDVVKCFSTNTFCFRPGIVLEQTFYWTINEHVQIGWNIERLTEPRLALTEFRDWSQSLHSVHKGSLQGTS